MAKGLNKVILIGNLGKNPEVRYTQNGDTVTNIILATSSSWKDKQTGEIKEKTEWHRIVFFNRLADVAKQHLHKGSKIYLEGSIRTKKWHDKNTNTEKYLTEIIANEMLMLDGKSNDVRPHGEKKDMNENEYDNDSFLEEEIPF